MFIGGGGVIVRGAGVVDGGGVVGGAGVVRQMFILCWLRCPWAMAAVRGRYLRTSADVISGKDAR